MKNIQAFLSICFILLTLTLSSCEVIGDIFKAGMWTAVVLIAVVVFFIMWLLRKIRGPRR